MSTADEEMRSRIVSKVTRRLIPFIFICYVIAYLDRVNLGFAGGGLQRDLGLDNTALGLGGSLFFFGYFLFEIPSNLILHRVGARIWIARIMIVWGIVSMAMAFVVGKWSFYAMRVILGLSEAGFFPGIILYLTYWVPARERAKTGALFMIAAPVAMAVGAPLSGALLKLDGMMDLKGWQWLFLVEGLPAILLGIATLKYLPSRPDEAKWLTSEECSWLSAELARERASKPVQDHAPLKESMLNPKIWLLCLFYFLNTTVTYGIFLWLPKIVESASGLKDFKLGLLTSSTLIPAIAGMILIGAHSDKTGERKWHTAACAFTAAIGLVMASFSGTSAVLLVASLALCNIGQRSVQGVFWSIPPVFLGGAAAAAGIAFINSVGNLGGQVGPWLMGWLKDTTGRYDRGLLVLAGVLLAEAALVLTLRMPSKEKPA